MRRRDLINYLNEHEYYKNPENAAIFCTGLEKVRRFFPRTKLTDALFKKPRANRLRDCVVYQVLKYDSYIKLHPDLCQKIQRYVLDWISGTREPYGRYTLPSKKIIGKYLNFMYEILKEDYEEPYFMEGRLNGVYEEYVKTSKETLVPVLYDAMRHEGKSLCQFVHLGYPVFNMLAGELDLPHLQKFRGMFVYHAMKQQVGRKVFINPIDLIRGCVEPNPGPFCSWCGFFVPVAMNSGICPRCNPSLYLGQGLPLLFYSMSVFCAGCKGEFPSVVPIEIDMLFPVSQYISNVYLAIVSFSYCSECIPPVSMPLNFRDSPYTSMVIRPEDYRLRYRRSMLYRHWFLRSFEAVSFDNVLESLLSKLFPMATGWRHEGNRVAFLFGTFMIVVWENQYYYYVSPEMIENLSSDINVPLPAFMQLMIFSGDRDLFPELVHAMKEQGNPYVLRVVFFYVKTVMKSQYCYQALEPQEEKKI